MCIAMSVGELVSAYPAISLGFFELITRPLVDCISQSK
jgi:hypothetical protein